MTSFSPIHSTLLCAGAFVAVCAVGACIALWMHIREHA